MGEVSLHLILISVLIAYLIGCISPSIMLAKAKGIDIKKEGSGNAGTTNALRVMGKKAGIITLIVDILKGLLAVTIGFFIGGSTACMYSAVAVFCGHVWPVFYKFKGGKGVATVFGTLLGIDVRMALVALLIVAIAVFISKRMSVGSIIGAACFPLIALLLQPGFVLPGTIMAVAVILKHKANIIRLKNGEEPIMSIFEKDK